MQTRFLANSSKQGFTLVEVVVTLVIISVLAAVLVPSLTGYIDKAKDASLYTETHTAVEAMQTVYLEDYAADFPEAAALLEKDMSFDNLMALLNYKNRLAKRAKELAGVSGTIQDFALNEQGGIETLTYKNKGKLCSYTAGGSIEITAAP